MSDCGCNDGLELPVGPKGDDGRGYDATSSTSLDTLDTAATTASLTITTEKAYTPGARGRASDAANPAVNFFEFVVLSYDPVTGAMSVNNIDNKNGSGTIANWNINLAGETGSTGATGAAGLTSRLTRDAISLVALTTASDGDKAVNFTLAFTPVNKTYILVNVSGQQVEVGDGVKTKDSYFSGDGGTTARGFDTSHPNGGVQIGDELFWNGSVITYELNAAVDIIDIIYPT